MPTVLTADVAGSVQVKGRQVSLQLSLPEFGLTRAEPTSTPPCTKAFAQKIQDGSISFHPSRAHTAPSELGRRIYGIQSDLGLMPRGVANSTGSNGAGLCYKESRRRLSFIASNLLHQSCEHLGLELFAKWSGSHWQQSGWRIGKSSFTRILPRATPPRSLAYSMIGLSTRKSESRSMGSSSGWHRPMSRSRSARSLGLRRLWELNQAPR